ncbi:hypothetical protein D9757_012212 [Collybiopsis confluens]|uniref:Uncharacterized protein n=1 Tax=Collybiopsis confluens TaxID=2823264 RepID=A0A8H5GLY1_9AGAR|nr:hypothetical protein D9757_012212 [Collybiopsis confluens]
MSQAATGSLPPDVIAELIAGVKESLATILIGFTLATILYGITVIQTYLYYKSYPKDQIWLKLFVAALWILDTLTTILVAHSIYTYTVLDFGDPEAEAKAASAKVESYDHRCKGATYV